MAGMTGAPVVLIQVKLQLCALELLLSYTALATISRLYHQAICGLAVTLYSSAHKKLACAGTVTQIELCLL